MMNRATSVVFTIVIVALVVSIISSSSALSAESVPKSTNKPTTASVPSSATVQPIQSRTTSQLQSALGSKIETITSSPVSNTKYTESEIRPDNTNLLLYIVLLVLSVATTLAVSISFYLYKWKKILLSQPNTLVPEKWGGYLANVGSSVDAQTEALNNNFGLIAGLTKESTSKITNLIDTFMALQKALDEKDTEIRRLKKGYDADIIRKFLFRFIRVDQYLEECLQSESFDKSSLEQIKKMLGFAFDECGVENFSPSIGEDFRQARGVSDNPKTKATDIVDDEYKIIEVIECGYRIKAGEDYDYIVPAKVKILTA